MAAPRTATRCPGDDGARPPHPRSRLRQTHLSVRPRAAPESRPSLMLRPCALWHARCSTRPLMRKWSARFRKSCDPATAVRIAGAVLVVLIFGAAAYECAEDRVALLAQAERNNENLVHLLAEQTARTIHTIDLTLLTV